jgi:hypothetical protein
MPLSYSQVITELGSVEIMSDFKFKSLEESLAKLPSDDLSEVKRILYGRADEYVE